MYFNQEFPYIFVYCFSCRFLVELGLRQLGLRVPNYRGFTIVLINDGLLVWGIPPLLPLLASHYRAHGTRAASGIFQGSHAGPTYLLTSGTHTHTWAKNIIPDPPTLAFLKKSKGNTEKSKGFSLRGTPKILGKARKSTEKSKGNRKKRESKKARIGGSGMILSWQSFIATTGHPAAKGVRQKESGKKVTKKVTKASEKVTEK